MVDVVVLRVGGCWGVVWWWSCWLPLVFVGWEKMKMARRMSEECGDMAGRRVSEKWREDGPFSSRVGGRPAACRFIA